MRRPLFLLIFLSFALQTFAQADATPSQRLNVLSDKLQAMRRSLDSMLSALKEDEKEKKKDKTELDTPIGRVKSLEREVSSLLNEVNNLRGKVDRSEKYEIKDIEQLESAAAELNTRVDNVLKEIAKERVAPVSKVGKPREVKKKTKKLLGLIPIGKERDEYEELIGTVSPGRDRELFIVATREVRKNNYEVGRLLFQVIITTYPDSPYLPMAKLAIADSFYLEGTTSSLIQASAAYQEWLTFFPTHPLSCRVMLKIAEAEMRQIGLPDRDITKAKRAEQRLKAFYQRCSDSPLKAEVDKRLEEVQNNLGLHNLGVANYYYNLSVKQGKGGLKGAQSRYLEILEKYPKFAYMDEVLYKLAVTYQIEEETDEAVKYFQRIVREYPNSEYVSKAKEQLQLMGASVPEPNPARLSVMPPKKESFFENLKNQFLGIYPLTINKDGVLMSDDFDKSKFELIDQIIENQGDLNASQIPQALTTVVRTNVEKRP
ncbi:MAG: outer membrane protein assembly factor BamD [Pyrinomonadaceae bacterium]|nr:outer membrane protein assembly factor BamD [Pyrinomonadaceae bacterium]MCX7640913.1 outer membrane protein assembly factor BamD [Pyrinomonadaceae bacterium]MDW8304695.1 outer membrane protein assembly factor BamD [Acidobacteriota bacterium]